MKSNDKGALIDAFFSPLKDSHSIAVNKSDIFSCGGCHSRDINGAHIYIGDYNTKISLCNDCLIKLQSDLQTSEPEGERTSFLSKPDDSSKHACSCCGSKAADCAVLSVGNASFFLCPKCLENLTQSLCQYNSSKNPIWIERDSARRAEQIKLRRQKLKERQAERQAKRKELQKVLVSDADFFYYDTLPNHQKDSFLLQKQSLHCFEDHYLHGSSEARPPSALKIVIKQALPLMQCSVKVHPADQSKARYFVNIPGSDFKVLFCKDCFLKLIKVMVKAMHESDALLTDIGGGVKILQKKHGTSQCHFCNKETGITLILNEVYIDICRECMEALIVSMLQTAKETDQLSDEEFSQMMTEEHEKAQAELEQAEQNKIHLNTVSYDDRKMKCAGRKTVINIGYPRKKAMKKPAEFVTNELFFPMPCEQIGHGYKAVAQYAITTNRSDDDFCLVLCPVCARNLKKSIDSNGKHTAPGTPVTVTTHTWNEREFCIFCGESTLPGYDIRIGNVRFYCCKSCKKKLSKALDIKKDEV